jgi:hypothetical protein
MEESESQQYFDRDEETVRFETYAAQDELDARLAELSARGHVVVVTARNLAQLLMDNVLGDIKGNCSAVVVLQSAGDPDERVLEVLDAQISLLWENDHLLYVLRPVK